MSGLLPDLWAQQSASEYTVHNTVPWQKPFCQIQGAGLFCGINLAAFSMLISLNQMPEQGIKEGHFMFLTGGEGVPFLITIRYFESLWALEANQKLSE